jgi:hypothetical protein
MKTRRPPQTRLQVEELEGRYLLSAASSNWAGYAVQARPGAVSAVSGTWVVPAVSGPGDAVSSAWVGIDGFASPTVEQIGTDSDLVNGTPVYYAWFEMYPSGLVPLTGLTIHAGDVISARVAGSGSGLFRLHLTDVTTGQSFTTTQRAASALRSSAEWIVEGPSSFFEGQLANFGQVTFSGASVTLGRATSGIDGASGQVVPINLAVQGATEASTSGLTDSGSASAGKRRQTSGFTVTYNAATPVVPLLPIWWLRGWRSGRRTDRRAWGLAPALAEGSRVGVPVIDTEAFRLGTN